MFEYIFKVFHKYFLWWILIQYFYMTSDKLMTFASNRLQQTQLYNLIDLLVIENFTQVFWQ